MPRYILLLAVVIHFLAIVACSNQEKETPNNAAQWSGKEVSRAAIDSLPGGSSYLSVYSSIFSFSENRTHDLTATISIRNINPQDSVYLLKADYYETEGKLVRAYLPQPIGLAPLETISIVIQEADQSGGTGANFLFDWKAKNDVHPPHFEAVMISTLGQQGLSFTTQGIRID